MTELKRPALKEQLIKKNITVLGDVLLEFRQLQNRWMIDLNDASMSESEAFGAAVLRTLNIWVPERIEASVIKQGLTKEAAEKEALENGLDEKKTKELIEQKLNLADLFRNWCAFSRQDCMDDLKEEMARREQLDKRLVNKGGK